MTNRVYEVYVCRYDGEVVYIGQGLKGRHKHCSSGISHVYGLNEIVFCKDKDLLEIHIEFEGRSQEEAKRLEKDLILKHRPVFNREFLVDNRVKRLREGKVVSVKLYAFPKLPKYSKPFERYNDLVKEFLDYHTATDILNKDVNLRSATFYRSLGYDLLAKLSKSIRHTNVESLKDSNPNKILYNCLRQEFGLDLRECIS